MTRANDTKQCFKNLIGWKQHYSEELQINPALTSTESGEYYQDFHPALDIALIAQSLNRGRDLNEYITTKTDTAITQLMNDIEAQRKAEGVKDILVSEVLLNKYGYANDKIYPEGRFVGFMFELRNSLGLNLTISTLGLQLSQVQELDIYLYHTSQVEPVIKKTVNVSKAVSWNWITEAINLYVNDGQIQGGTYFIGYYQDELVGQAINYTDFDWSKGYCGTCDGGIMRRKWNKVKEYVYFMPMYVPAGKISEDKFMFDARDVMVDNYKSWGLNFGVKVTCDLTDFMCANRASLKNALGLKMAWLVLQDIKFSQEFNHINEDLKNLIIRDLEGDKDTYNFGIASRYKQELKNVTFDVSNISKYCLPCQELNAPDYGAA